MNFTDFPGLQRKPDTQEIDIKGSIHIFAQGVLTLKAEESRIRSMRRYKAAVLKVFEDNKDQEFLHLEPLAFLAVEKLRHKKENITKLWEEMKRHILLNHKRYLRVDRLRIYSDTDIYHVRLLKP